MLRISSNKKLLVLIFLFFGQIIISLSERTFSGNDESGAAGYSLSGRLTNEISSFSEIKDSESKIRDFIDKWNIAGASVAITKEERLIYAKGFGYADTASKEQVQPKHLFRIASISKLITAVAIMNLVEDGTLNIDDKVFGNNGLLDDPKFLDIKDPRVKDITIKNLLTHSGGWSKFSGDPVFMPYTIKSAMDVSLPVDLETTIRYTLKMRSLDFDPGEESSYSNFGYAVLGKVIEKVTRMDYEQYVISEILNPLGIYDMHIGSAKLNGKYANEVKYYSNSKYLRSYSSYNQGKIVPRQYGGNNFQVLEAAGAWVASPAELMKLIVHIDGLSNKQDILSEESIQKMIHPENSVSPIGWVNTTGDGSWRRTGTLTGTSALLKKQDNGLSWIIVLNTSNDIGHEFTDNLDTLMTNVVDDVNYWPEYDLFYYSNPKSFFSFTENND